MEACLHCKTSRFTPQNNGKMHRIVVPGGVVHLVCLGPWSDEYLIQALFPGIIESEAQVMRLRLRPEGPRQPSFLTLDEIAQRLGRSAMSVSKQQRLALKRLKEKTVQDRKMREDATMDAEAALAAFQAAKRLVEVLCPRFDPLSEFDSWRDGSRKVSVHKG